MYRINNELAEEILTALRHKTHDFKFDMQHEILIVKLRRCQEKLFCRNCGFEKFDKKDICPKYGC